MRTWLVVVAVVVLSACGGDDPVSELGAVEGNAPSARARVEAADLADAQAAAQADAGTPAAPDAAQPVQADAGGPAVAPQADAGASQGDAAATDTPELVPVAERALIFTDHGRCNSLGGVDGDAPCHPAQTLTLVAHSDGAETATVDRYLADGTKSPIEGNLEVTAPGLFTYTDDHYNCYFRIPASGALSADCTYDGAAYKLSGMSADSYLGTDFFALRYR